MYLSNCAFICNKSQIMLSRSCKNGFIHKMQHVQIVQLFTENERSLKNVYRKYVIWTVNIIIHEKTILTLLLKYFNKAVHWEIKEQTNIVGAVIHNIDIDFVYASVVEEPRISIVNVHNKLD